MMTVQRSLQHVSPGSFCGNTRLHASAVPARNVALPRRPLQVQAVQTDVVAAVSTLAVSTIQSAFAAGVAGGAFGALSTLASPGRKLVPEAINNFSGTMRVGALMGLSGGTLLNLGVDPHIASMGGVAVGLGLYAALVTTMNLSSK